MIPQHMVDRASKLGLKDVRDALRRNGYEDESQEIKEVVFQYKNLDGHYIYEIMYEHEGKMEVGKVFIEIKQDLPRPTFSYFADY